MHPQSKTDVTGLHERSLYDTVELFRKSEAICHRIQERCFEEAKAMKLVASAYERPQGLHTIESELRDLAAYMNLVVLNMDTLTKRFIKTGGK